MCGRYSLSTPSAIKAHFDVPFPDDLSPRYNIAPSQLATVIRVRDGVRELALMRWGLVPFWTKDRAIGNRMINARAETITTKPAYRRALASQRCLVPADGFYEWEQDGKRKIPFWFHREGRGLFAFAGLWDRWRDPKGEELETFAIVTTEANNFMKSFHDRMPHILAPADYDQWLRYELSPALSSP